MCRLETTFQGHAMKTARKQIPVSQTHIQKARLKSRIVHWASIYPSPALTSHTKLFTTRPVLLRFANFCHGASANTQCARTSILMRHIQNILIAVRSKHPRTSIIAMKAHALNIAYVGNVYARLCICSSSSSLLVLHDAVTLG